MKKILLVLLFMVVFAIDSFAANRVDLTIAYKTVYFAGKPRQAIAVNNQIPAPVLHFKQGDHVRINVRNHLDKNVTIHWHGLIVPWQMDGVEGVSQRPIPPGGSFHYQFTLYQSGTYWYHAHQNVQEQEGLYGAFIIDPLKPPVYKYSKDYVVVLSDWINAPAEHVYANLKKQGDYYASRFPLQPSLMKFIHDYRRAIPQQRKILVSDYKMMQAMRMNIYDFSDIAYDAYLLNGKAKSQPWNASVKVGDVVRLRFIGAGGSTIYRVKVVGAKMEVVHIQGNDVHPSIVDYFTIAPGETEDVLIKITKHRPYIIYAESLDKRGVAMGALLTDSKHKVDYTNITPFPEPEPVTREMMANMMEPAPALGSPHATHASANSATAEAHHHMTANHAMSMSMPTEPLIIGDTIATNNALNSVKTIGTKYQHLKSAVSTNDPNKPVNGIIKMELFGYMDRYIWMINGLPEYKAKPILILPGKRYRIIFTNNSMMRHPMHIHGHWFILRNGHGMHDPLLHTIEVPPGAIAVADFDTDASGQWFFHCHHLYHMMSGMSRIFQYATIIDVAKNTRQPQTQISQGIYINRPIVRVDEQVPIDATLISHPMAHPFGLNFATSLDVGADPFGNVQRLTYRGLYGSDYNKLEMFTNDAELNKGKVENADIDIFYWRLISQFWAIKGGINYFYRPAQTPYLQPGIGIEGLMPYFIDTNARIYYYDGSVKLDIELLRDTQLTNNFFIRLGIRSILATKTIPQADIGSGLNQMRYIIRPYYRLIPGLNLFFEYENEHNYGQFNGMQLRDGEKTNQNTYTFGIAVLF